MLLLEKIHLRLSWLSIDVVLGALAGLVFFSKLLRIELEWQVFLLLGLAVWSIYTADHLLDSRQKTEVDLSPRHLFHLKYKNSLRISLGLVLICGLSLAYYTFDLSSELGWSLILGTLISASMLLIRLAGRRMAWAKEISIALFYVLGIAWIPLLRVKVLDLSWEIFLFLGSYTLLALINLLILSHLDRRQDQLGGFFSSAFLFPPIKFIELIRRLCFLSLLIGLASFILLPSFYRPFSCILTVMSLVHYLAFFNPKLSAEKVRLRTEAVFILPVLLYFL
ncbi:MAG: hypothetical protein ACI9ZX_001391 [Algoriphagus sp.]|jgi:hypothetical protein